MSIDVFVLGRDHCGLVARMGSSRFYLTDCCYAATDFYQDPELTKDEMGVIRWELCCKECYEPVNTPTVLPRTLLRQYFDEQHVGIPYDEFVLRADEIQTAADAAQAAARLKSAENRLNARCDTRDTIWDDASCKLGQLATDWESLGWSTDLPEFVVAQRRITQPMHFALKILGGQIKDARAEVAEARADVRIKNARAEVAKLGANAQTAISKFRLSGNLDVVPANYTD